MGQNILQANGGQAQKPTHFVSLFTSRFLAGLYTNRNLLRGPMQYIYSDFYHLGSTDALADGLNSELSVRQTMIRRPGNPKYCTIATDSAVDAFYSFHQSDGTIQVIVDTTAKIDVMTPTTLTTIFTKTSGAGQGYFQGVNKSLYIADGIDLVKYIPSGPNNPSTNTPVWNFGGAAPTVQPTIQITETGAAGQAWAALTYFTSMGLLVDSNNNVQWLISVNADPINNPNTTQIGTAGSGQPTFSLTNGNTISDGTVTWTSSGPVTLWSPNRSAPFLSVIYDPVTNGLFFQSHSSPGGYTGATVAPKFNTGTLGTATDDPQTGTPGGFQAARWRYLGQAPSTPLWAPSTVYGTFPVSYPATIPATSFIVTPVRATSPIVTAGTPVLTVQFATTGGTSTTYSHPVWSTTPGNPTQDGQLQWQMLSSKTWPSLSPVIAFAGATSTFTAIVDTNGNYQVCIVGGTTGASHPTWNTDFGSITYENGTTVGWANCGTASNTNTWTAGFKWYLPQAGFNPPLPGQPWGGANVIGSNVVQFVQQSGKSAASPPSWNGVGATTTDGTITWYGEAAFNPNGFSWTKGYGYVYAFKARGAADPICTTAPNLPWVSINTPPNPQGLGPPTGCGDGSVTTASPVIMTATGANAGAINTISGFGSADPQFDTIIVFRSADGFAAGGPYLYLTECPMPAPVNGSPGMWHVYDNMPDTATATLPGLNPLIEAPVDHVNDPPPGQFGSTQFIPSTPASQVAAAGTALKGVVYHQGRLWGFLGNTVFASGGPATNPGNGMTAWPPVNEFPFDSPVVLLVPTATALLVFTTTDILLIGGGPNIADYYSQLLAPGIGIQSPNAVAMVVGLPYLFSSDRQLILVDPSGGFTRVGHPIGDKLVAYNPANVYVTYHSYGDGEHAIYIANGAGEWYRCDPNPTPDSQLTGPVWSPRAVGASSFKAVQSVEVSPGNTQLLIGPSSASFVLNRDSTFTTFTDNGSAYSSYFVMGNIVLAHPGQMAQCSFIEMDFVKTGAQPTVSVLFDELGPFNGAAFETISNQFVSDPPKLYGPTAVPNTLWMNRYYFGQTTPGNGGNQIPLPAWCKFLQLKVDFGNTDTVQNELLAFTIFGALFQEK
jgi:hypothetical protein